MDSKTENMIKNRKSKIINRVTDKKDVSENFNLENFNNYKKKSAPNN